MTEVLTSPSHFPSSPRQALSCDPNDGAVGGLLSPFHGVGGVEEDEEGGSHGVVVDEGRGTIERKRERRRRRGGGGGVVAEAEEGQQISVLALLLTLVRKSLLSCKTEGGSDEELHSMQIGWPTEVRHIAHVTFDRFHGFLGLPVEFEPEVPHRAPSASTYVFGVSTESMQCSYDSRGNSVPTILLSMQRRLYEQGGLRVEGIFRIAADNSQEEYVRDQLNNGVVLEGVDVHCLAGLIKAWFRELPTGLLDSLSSEQVMQYQTEEDCDRLARLLPPTEAALLDWAVNLMADVVQEEEQNKMNARNVATVFAPNMAQMADPLTALMYAVQVMNFLRMLILKTLKDRQDATIADASISNRDPSDENGHQSPQLHIEACSEKATENDFGSGKLAMDSDSQGPEESDINEATDSPQTSHDSAGPGGTTPYISTDKFCRENPAHTDGSSTGPELAAKGSNAIHVNSRRVKISRSNSQTQRKGRKSKGQSTVRASLPTEKSKGVSIVSRIDSKAERVEAWR